MMSELIDLETWIWIYKYEKSTHRIALEERKKKRTLMISLAEQLVDKQAYAINFLFIFQNLDLDP